MKKFLRAKELSKFLGVSESTIWRWTAANLLPKPIRITSRTTVWDFDEVLEFINKKHQEAINVSI